MVSSAFCGWGSQSGFGSEQMEYFKRISNLNLKNQQIVGLELKMKKRFNKLLKYQKEPLLEVLY